MTVYLRPMTPEEFIPYEDADAHHYAENMVRAGFWQAEGAFNKAKEIHARLLPEGIHTRDHLFFVIQDVEKNEPIGVTWLYIDHENRPPSGFIYDIRLYEQFRGQGLGRQAMLALEQKAKDLGLSSLSLNVFEENAAARALYGSLGYQVKSSTMRKTLLTEQENS